MRLLSAILIFFASFSSIAQTADTSKVKITSNCFSFSFSKGLSAVLADKMGCGIVYNPRLDTTQKIKNFQIRCMRTLTEAENPLIVVDGILLEQKNISDLNPSDIESISVLKESNATNIFCHRGTNGVIIITTKRIAQQKIIVKDFFDGSAIPGATVSFISANRKDTLMMAANDSGIAITDKLKRNIEYEINVSAVGYKKIIQRYSNTFLNFKTEILLSREEKNCLEAIIISSDSRKISCGSRYYTIKTEAEAKAKTEVHSTFKIFPNPVVKGNSINIQYHQERADAYMIRVANPNGKILLQQFIPTNDKVGNLQVQIDSRWAAGVYFLQLFYANGQPVASEKIMVQ